MSPEDGAPSWPPYTKGDLIASTAAGFVKLPVGSDGDVLTADSTETSGIKWDTPAAAPDTIYTADGSLTSNRTLTTGAFSLEFVGDDIRTTTATIGGIIGINAWDFNQSAIRTTGTQSITMDAASGAAETFAITANNSGAGDGILTLSAKTSIGLASPTISSTSLRINGTLLDTAGSAGTSGQMLTSTGVGTAWGNPLRVYRSTGLVTSSKTFVGVVATIAGGVFNFNIAPAGFGTIYAANVSAVRGGSIATDAPIATIRTVTTAVVTGLVVMGVDPVITGSLTDVGAGINVHLIVYGV